MNATCPLTCSTLRRTASEPLSNSISFRFNAWNAPRMVFEHQGEHESQWSAIKSISAKNRLHGGDVTQVGAAGRMRPRPARRAEQRRAGAAQGAGARESRASPCQSPHRRTTNPRLGRRIRGAHRRECSATPSFGARFIVSGPRTSGVDVSGTVWH